MICTNYEGTAEGKKATEAKTHPSHGRQQSRLTMHVQDAEKVGPSSDEIQWAIGKAWETKSKFERRCLINLGGKTVSLPKLCPISANPSFVA